MQIVADEGDLGKGLYSPRFSGFLNAGGNDKMARFFVGWDAIVTRWLASGGTSQR